MPRKLSTDDAIHDDAASRVVGEYGFSVLVYPELTHQLLALADDGCPNFPAEYDPVSASLGPAIAELERAFRAFSDLSFKRQLPLPVITIQTRGRASAAGWFWKQKWKTARPDRLPEINVSAEYLNEPVDQIAESCSTKCATTLTISMAYVTVLLRNITTRTSNDVATRLDWYAEKEVGAGRTQSCLPNYTKSSAESISMPLRLSCTGPVASTRSSKPSPNGACDDGFAPARSQR